jgi:flagellar biosynthesis activator protein FlaF
MRYGAQAYGAVAREIASPRDLEATLLLRAAARLQAVCDSWSDNKTDLQNALLYNRKLWTVFLDSVMNKESHLPVEIRQNVANLGLFVMKQTLSLTSDPKPENVEPLININRQLAAGLREQK